MGRMTLTICAVGLLVCGIAQADLGPPLAEVGSIDTVIAFDPSTHLVSLAGEGVQFGAPEDIPPLRGSFDFSLLASLTTDDAISGGVFTIFGTIPALGITAPTLVFAAHVTGGGFGLGANAYDSFTLAVDYSNPSIGTWGPSADLFDNPIGYSTIPNDYAGSSINPTTLEQLFSQAWYSSPADYYVLQGSFPTPEPSVLVLLALALFPAAGLSLRSRKLRLRDA